MIHVLYCVYKMSGSSSALWPDLRSVMVLKCAWASVLSAKMDTCTVQWLVFIVPVATLQPGGIAQDKHFFSPCILVMLKWSVLACTKRFNMNDIAIVNIFNTAITLVFFLGGNCVDKQHFRFVPLEWRLIWCYLFLLNLNELPDAVQREQINM